MAIPTFLNAFDVETASVTVWLFKSYGGEAGSTPRYSGRWIASDDALDEALKMCVIDARARISEVHEYGLLAQTNEASALSIDTVETHAGLIVAQSADALPQRQVQKPTHWTNTKFFVIRFTNGQHVLHAVRRTDASWQTHRRKSLIDMVIREEVLTLNRSPSFSLTKHIDFFIADNQVVISNKAAFESVLRYREAHAQDFSELREEAGFASLFSTLTPLMEFVGSNKIHLRRMCSIRQKAHYKDLEFMTRLRKLYATYGLNLEFDANGLIVPSVETCRDIMTALLDHRLSSAFSANIYDVPDATKVN